MEGLDLYVPKRQSALNYYLTQDQRPSPFVADGIRRCSRQGKNPRFIIDEGRTEREEEIEPSVKVELTSEIKKTLDQTHEDMAAARTPVYKPGRKRCPSQRQKNPRRQVKKRGGGDTKKKRPAPPKKKTATKRKAAEDIFSNGRRIKKNKHTRA